jgi:hypothetical protein
VSLQELLHPTSQLQNWPSFGVETHDDDPFQDQANYDQPLLGQPKFKDSDSSSSCCVLQ